MLKIQNLGKSFNGKSALSNVTLEVERGSFIGVIGRSGAGKSTLLRCLNRLNEPSTGSITFDGVDITKLKGQGLRDWRAKCAMICSPCKNSANSPLRTIGCIVIDDSRGAAAKMDGKNRNNSPRRLRTHGITA